MTNEEAFKISADGLLKQGCRSMNSEYATCAFRGQNNTRCAIGLLILDEDFLHGFVIFLIEDILDNELAGSLHGLDRAMLLGLMHIHDAYFPPRWKVQLLELATQCNLNWTPPQAEEAGA